jgi:hypothetical protein
MRVAYSRRSYSPWSPCDWAPLPVAIIVERNPLVERRFFGDDGLFNGSSKTNGTYLSEMARTLPLEPIHLSKCHSL